MPSLNISVFRKELQLDGETILLLTVTRLFHQILIQKPAPMYEDQTDQQTNLSTEPVFA